ncbi:Ribokinase-like protein [Wilcoxina mikolae CBS 423.85]|nr:Ribokinase-like protein [Wilcoxina mikolae CBS 423.85]
MGMGGEVLAIASHVLLHRYVGNNITTFVLQLLGLETAGLNSVQFSNHSGYGQLKGFRTTAQQIVDLFEGMKMSGLLEGFDMMLTGYVPGERELEAVGEIAKEVKETKRSCFWLLDPVMGDQGKLYVSEGVVPVYKSLVPHADLIVPNQFEAKMLSGIKVDSIETLSRAIDSLHTTYKIPHVVITSVTFTNGAQKMKCAGSSMTSTGAARKFIIDVPIIDGFFSGTGDLFAALTLARLREFSDVAGLLEEKSWMPPDEVETLDLPLTKAIEVVLGSMHMVLEKTREARDRILEKEKGGKDEAKKHVAYTRASELRLVQCQKEILTPGMGYKAVVLV